MSERRQAMAMAALAALTLVPQAVLAGGASWLALLAVAGGLLALAPVVARRYGTATALLTTLALAQGTALTWRVGLAGDAAAPWLFLAGSAALLLALEAPRPALRLAAATSGLLALLVGCAPRHPLAPLLLPLLFAAPRGLLYGAPLLWLALPGFLRLARREPRLAAVLAAATAALLLDLSLLPVAASLDRATALLPLLALPLAAALSGLVRFASRRPLAALAAAAVALVLGNLTFMEVYRRDLIPRDDTVAFPEVARDGAGLWAEAAGAPLSWPGNWLLALRTGLPVTSVDRALGTVLLEERDVETIDVGMADAEADRRLLASGFSVRRPCGAALCREVEGLGRVLLPLRRRETVELRLVAAGEGALQLTLSDTPAGAVTLTPDLRETAIVIPAERWPGTTPVLGLTPAPGSRALVDRIVLRRRGGV